MNTDCRQEMDKAISEASRWIAKRTGPNWRWWHRFQFNRWYQTPLNRKAFEIARAAYIEVSEKSRRPSTVNTTQDSQ